MINYLVGKVYYLQQKKELELQEQEAQYILQDKFQKMKDMGMFLILLMLYQMESFILIFMLMVMEKVTTEEQEQKKKKLLRIYLLYKMTNNQWTY